MVFSKSSSYLKMLITISSILIIIVTLTGCSNKQSSIEASSILNSEKNLEITNNTLKNNNIINNNSKTDSSDTETGKEAINITIGDIQYNFSTLLKLEDIQMLGSWELSLLRNAYYARYGYTFKMKEYSDFFSKYEWYIAKYENVNEFFTEDDMKNINLILTFEKNLSNKEHDVVINSQDFFNLKNCIIKNITAPKNKYDFEAIIQAKGEYDLNNDGNNDVINIQMKRRDDSLICINNSKLNIYVDNPYEVYLVDLISDDNFIEIAIYDDGPSGDPYTTFYRYDGESIKEISGGFSTDIDSENSISAFYGQVLTNGKGIFISPKDNVQFVSPNIIKGYTILKDNEFVHNSIDYSKSLNKEYTFTSDLSAFFIKQKISDDLCTKDINFTWNEEHSSDFYKDQKIKINVMDDDWFWYGIELEDGTTGVMYFWIGD